jgi:peptide chain release factor 1
MDEKEKLLRARYHELEEKLQDHSIFSTPDGQKIAKEHSDISATLSLIDEYVKINNQLRETEELARGDDELAELAKNELPEIIKKHEELKENVDNALTPRDPRENRNAIVEIRAGAGGDEASLFAGELYRMYALFCERMKWKIELLSESPSEVGGFKEVIFNVLADGAYGQLKYESGVHRVQRVPKTESSGRIHTSTATVAVLPEAEEADVEINPSDLRIDVFRSGGPGGQSVNTTDSAVRVTHVPTGIIVTCQDEKSQHKNKAKALNVLRSRLLAQKIEDEQKQRSTERKSQIGSGDRSEKIRTYNFAQDRVTDHRINLSLHNLPGILAGEIDELLSKLRQADRKLATEQ